MLYMQTRGHPRLVCGSEDVDPEAWSRTHFWSCLVGPRDASSAFGAQGSDSTDQFYRTAEWNMSGLRMQAYEAGRAGFFGDGQIEGVYTVSK